MTVKVPLAGKTNESAQNESTTLPCQLLVDYLNHMAVRNFSEEKANSTDYRYQEDLEFIFEGVLLVVVGVFGIFGNCAILVMFSR